jgi:hypothetical protein
LVITTDWATAVAEQVTASMIAVATRLAEEIAPARRVTAFIDSSLDRRLGVIRFRGGVATPREWLAVRRRPD